jgi:glutathione S-transferase
MPADLRARSEAVECLFAALNSVEMASLPWSLFQFSGDTLKARADQMAYFAAAD